MMVRFIALSLLPALFSASLVAQDAAEPAVQAEQDAEPVHQQLRQLRDRMYAAYQDRDMERLLEDVTPQVVVTWQNAQRTEGHDELLAFYDRMMQGEDRVVEDVSSQMTVDELSVLYGDDTAVARGTLVDRFDLRGGSEFTLHSKWTATVVKQDQQWKVASFHVSADIFDNAILDTAKSWLVNAGVGGVLAGLLIGFALAWMIRRRSAKRASVR